MARAARETTNIEKYRTACATAREVLKPTKDVHRKLTEEETLAIVRKVDEVLGFCSPSDPYPEKPAAPGPRFQAQAASQFEVQDSQSKAQSSPSAPTALASAAPTCPSAASQFEVQGSLFKVQSSPSAATALASASSTCPSAASQFEIQGSQSKAQSSPSAPTALAFAAPTSPSAASQFEGQGSQFKVQSSGNPPLAIQPDNSVSLESPPLPLKPELADLSSPNTKQPSAPVTAGPPLSPPAIENQNSKIESRPEHCLECGVLLPKLSPNGGRPRQHCDKCHFELPPPFCCVEPSIEQCRTCRANLPRLRPDGRRPETHCHHCGAPIIDPVPISQASSNAPPDTPKLQAA